MSPCPSCGSPVIHVKLCCSGRFVMADLPLGEWTDPARRNPGTRVVTYEGAVVIARHRTADLAHHPAIWGWAVHRCDPLFKIP